jgi:hypothetical protein
VATTHEKEIEHLKQCLKQKFDITSHDFTKHLGLILKGWNQVP